MQLSNNGGGGGGEISALLSNFPGTVNLEL